MDAKILEQIRTVDGGRFASVPTLCTSMETAPCEQCYYFHPGITDPKDGYRCATVPSCPGKTLSTVVKSFLWVKIGWMTVEERHKLLSPAPEAPQIAAEPAVEPVPTPVAHHPV